MSENRLLAVGGLHVFKRRTACALIRATPAGALVDLRWSGMLAVRADGEGTASVRCGRSSLHIEAAQPVRLEVQLENPDAAFVVGKPFRVRAWLYDRRNRELEVGELTALEWTATGVLEVANDPSAGEFGYCDTCFGMHQFRAARLGKGTIEARLGKLVGVVQVDVRVGAHRRQAPSQATSRDPDSR